jgi:hypothetical protein
MYATDAARLIEFGCLAGRTGTAFLIADALSTAIFRRMPGCPSARGGFYRVDENPASVIPAT